MFEKIKKFYIRSPGHEMNNTKMLFLIPLPQFVYLLSFIIFIY